MGLIHSDIANAVIMHPDTLDLTDILPLLLELIGVYKDVVEDFCFSTILVMKNLKENFRSPRFVAPAVAISIGDFAGGSMTTKNEEHKCMDTYRTHNVLTTINMTWRHNIDKYSIHDPLC